MSDDHLEVAAFNLRHEELAVTVRLHIPVFQPDGAPTTCLNPEVPEQIRTLIAVVWLRTSPCLPRHQSQALISVLPDPPPLDRQPCQHREGQHPSQRACQHRIRRAAHAGAARPCEWGQFCNAADSIGWAGDAPEPGR